MNREDRLNRMMSRGMLCGKKIVNNLTGESERKAGKQAVKELAKGREAVSRLTQQSRDMLPGMFESAQDMRRAGLRGGLDAFRRGVPMQADLLQGGNVAAQQTLLAGLPQIQRAIMGQPVNLSGLQANRQDFNFAVPEALPFAGRVGKGIPAPEAPAETEQPQVNLANLLRGNQ